jgi:hypothetical protein
VNQWRLIKDVLLTGLGMFAIYSQLFRQHPDGLILGAGLALTVPSIASHVRALLPGPGDGDSSPPPPPAAAPPPAPSSGEVSTGE